MRGMDPRSWSIDATLNDKLLKFPHLTLPRDKQKLYEPSDILSEVKSVKVDPQFSALFYYDTSSGVNPNVAKLSLSLQNKWTDRAVRYKQINDVLFPRFSYFVSFICEITSASNHPSFDNEVHHRSNEPKHMYKTKLISSKTGIQPDEEGNIRLFCPLHPNTLSHTLDECLSFLKKSYEEQKIYLKQNIFCFRCCRSNSHIKRNKCGSTYHCSAVTRLRSLTVVIMFKAGRVNRDFSVYDAV